MDFLNNLNKLGSAKPYDSLYDLDINAIYKVISFDKKETRKGLKTLLTIKDSNGKEIKLLLPDRYEDINIEKSNLENNRTFCYKGKEQCSYGKNMHQILFEPDIIYNTIFKKLNELNEDNKYQILNTEKFQTEHGPRLLLLLKGDSTNYKVFLPERFKDVNPEEFKKRKLNLIYKGKQSNTQLIEFVEL